MDDYDFRFDVVLENLDFLLGGLQVTVGLSVISMILGTVLGIGTAILRTSRFRVVRWTAIVYTEAFRTLPLLVILYWIYSGLPILAGITLTGFVAAVLAFSLNVGAFQAENFRAGILSVNPGQRHAGLAIGMTEGQVMRRIVLPQAGTRIIPLIGTEWVSLFKNTSLVAVVTVHDVMYRARVLATETFRPLEIFTVAAVVYFILVYPQARLVEALYRRYLPEDE